MNNIYGAVSGLAFAAAWFTHLFVCFSDDRRGFLIAWAIMFPIAIVHGIGILVWCLVKNSSFCYYFDA